MVQPIYKKLIAITLTPWLAFPFIAGAAQEGPEEPVEQFTQTLEEVLERKTGGIRERIQRIHKGMEETFALEARARAVLGPQWNGLQAEQRQRFVRSFRRLGAVALYGQLAGNEGSRLEEVRQQEVSGGTTIIEYRLGLDGEDPLPLRYLVRKEGTAWRIWSLEIDGVSDVATNRAQYRAILEEKGMEALIQKLEDRLRKIAKESMSESSQPDWH